MSKRKPNYIERLVNPEIIKQGGVIIGRGSHDSVTFATVPGHRVPRSEYVTYLRDCARRWRAEPTNGTDAARAANEEQALRVEAKADRIESGMNE